MGASVGFDLSPPLEDTPRDNALWTVLLVYVKCFYQDDPNFVINPTYLEFTVGEHPSLPLAGYKFRRFASKVTGPTASRDGTREYLDTVQALAEKIFHERIKRYNELIEDFGVYTWTEVYDGQRGYWEQEVEEADGLTNAIAGVSLRDDDSRSSSAPASAESRTIPTTLYKETKIPSKGAALIANAPITAGALILAEAPLFTVPTAIITGNTDVDAVKSYNTLIQVELIKLPLPKRAALLRLHNAHPDPLVSPFLGIVSTNAFGLGEPGYSDESGIFAIASRFNHSCSPNVDFVWRASSGKSEFRATRDIAEGEELLVSYLGGQIDLERDARKAVLKDRYHFDCACSSCSLTGVDLTADNAKRRVLTRMDAAVGGGVLIATEPGRALKYCREIARIRTEMSRGREIARAYYDAFQVCVAHGDAARAGAFMAMNVEVRELYEGAEHVEGSSRELIRRPQGHRLWERVSRKWTSKVKQGKKKGDAGFEEWLWARAEK